MADDKNDPKKGADDKSVEDWAKKMGVKPEQLREAMKKYNQDATDLTNVQKRTLLAQAIDQGWTRDQFLGAYKTLVPKSADWDWNQIVRQYGFSLGVLKEYRADLQPIFKWFAKKLQEGETVDNLKEDFFRKLAQTDFGKRTPEEVNADLQRYGAEKRDFRDNLNDLAKEIREIARTRFGGNTLKAVEGAAAREIALDLIYNEEGFVSGSFDSEKIVRRLRAVAADADKKAQENAGKEQGLPADEVLASNEEVATGVLGKQRNDLMAWLSRNGIVLTKDRVDTYARQMEDGTLDLDGVKQDVRNRFFTPRYMAYGDLFRQGLDVSDVALDFRQTAAQLLEKPLESITLDDPRVQKALQYKGPDGKPSPMALYEFEQELRKDPEWDKTNNAMEAYMQLADTLLKDFGMRG